MFRSTSTPHLDIGPGTGYFLEEAAPPGDAEITLLDPNATVLRHAAKRLERWHPAVVEADVVMKPLPVEEPFDYAALSFVLHCLRGPDANKAIAVKNIADVLTPEGVLFGRDDPRTQSQPHNLRADLPSSRQQAGRLRQPRRHC